ncbi:hypothetical protein [Metamycoplasma buccale]|uniref:hypothetical protein n=1 Tax=Metamycoplasma buccale TaxID=55602 RepID=UPI00398EE11E
MIETELVQKNLEYEKNQILANEIKIIKKLTKCDFKDYLYYLTLEMFKNNENTNYKLKNWRIVYDG